MMTVHRILLATIVASVGVLPLAAQDQPQPTLTSLQGKNTLSDEERNTLAQWMNERIAAIGAEEPAPAAEALTLLRTEFKGTDAFKEAYAAALIESVRPAYKNAKLIAAARLITALNTLNDPDARGVLLEALQDQRVGVRMAAVVGLRNLRVKLALAGTPVFTETLNGLRDAGKRETSSVTLKTIYQAMDYPAVVPSLPDAKANVATVLDLLEARAQQYAAREVPAEGAEVVGLKLGGTLRSAMDDAQRKRLTVIAAKMLRYGVTRYTSGDRPLFKVQKDAGRQIKELRNQIELLIDQAEKLLLELVAPKDVPTPSIAEEMKKAADPILMKIAMNKWADILKKAVNLDFYMDEAEGPTPPEEPPDGGG
ncbi:MAG TPA: hypothetical protein VM487_02995 [Phycisphaerae bacterium]|nr:hypothetical protein [Phycisphaerae bacterium]